MNDQALITSWNEIHTQLFHFIASRVKDRDVAADITQDVFVKVQTRTHQLRNTEKITSWIFQIARHTITDHFRNATKKLDVTEMNWESDTHELNDCVAYCLNKLIKQLPASYREALELTELHNVSQTDLAKRLNISYSGAKSRVQRARQLLKEKMNALYAIKTDAYGNVIACEDRQPCDCKSQYRESIATNC